MAQGLAPSATVFTRLPAQVLQCRAIEPASTLNKETVPVCEAVDWAMDGQIASAAASAFQVLLWRAPWKSTTTDLSTPSPSRGRGIWIQAHSAMQRPKILQDIVNMRGMERSTR